MLLRKIVLALSVLGLGLCPFSLGCDESDDEREDASSREPPDIDLDAMPMVDLEEPLPDAGTLPYDCEIGVMSDTGGALGELPPGGPIPIGGFGQAGLTARLGLRCTPSGDADPLKEASISMTLINPFTAITAPRKPRTRGMNLSCTKTPVCIVVPILIEISHLAKLPQLEGLPARVDAEVFAIEDPSTIIGRARTHGVFKRNM